MISFAETVKEADKKAILDEFYELYIKPSYPEGSASLDSLRDSISKWREFVYLPKELRPAEIYSEENVNELHKNTLFAALNKNQLETVAWYVSTDAGRKRLVAAAIAIRDQPGRSHIDEDNTSREINAILGTISEEDREILSKKQEELTHVAEALDHEFKKAYADFFIKKISDYYEVNEFSDNDSRICEASLYSGITPYMIAVCSQGQKNNDYFSSLVMGMLYASGNQVGSAEDLPPAYRVTLDHDKAKHILRSILKFDKHGDAHYALANVIKQAPNPGKPVYESYCLMLEAARRGYKKANEALKSYYLDAEKASADDCKQK